MSIDRAKCSSCGANIPVEDGYTYESKFVCEDCYIDLRSPKTRKTHWQYIKSVKTEYLIPKE